MERTILLFLMMSFGLSPALVTGVSERQGDQAAYSFLVGSWEGELEYLDYGDDATLVRLPSRLVCEPSDDGVGLKLEFAFEEPDGRVVTSSERLFATAEGVRLGGLWKIEERSSNPQTGIHRLILSRVGMDNGRTAEIRNEILVQGDELTITKLVKYADTPAGSGDWLQRHQYRLTREA